MYSYEIKDLIQKRDYRLKVEELNNIMSCSPQVSYQICGDFYKYILIQIIFHDLNEKIEVKIIG